MYFELRNLFLFILLVSLLFFVSHALAHPEDEFCEGAVLDPMLCAELAELDRSRSTFGNTTLPEIALDRSMMETGLLYIRLGFEHILPMGLDHLAFVLALILASRSLKVLLIQISVFTLAHSVTLILGVLNYVELDSKLVEIIIALSIVFVAFENLFIKLRINWRAIVVFFFGLLHGLGFAGALSELGVPKIHFASALIGFNLGVELGQVVFGIAMFTLLHKRIWKSRHKRFIFIPGNIVVAMLGIYWLLERLY